MSEPIFEILTGDALEQLRTLPDACFSTCVTSPPYFGLRDYGIVGQIGLEPTPFDYIENLVTIFREVHRVLRDDGTLWLNLGDSYAGSGKGPSGRTGVGKQEDRQGFHSPRGDKLFGLKHKDLMGIPWHVAFALQADGWYLRQDIIWHKPNPMPESVRDRCTRAHEYIFMLSKKRLYYYNADAIKTPSKNPEDDLRRMNQQAAKNKSAPTETVNGLRPRTEKQRGHSRRHDGFNDRWDAMPKSEQQAMGANKRSVWTVPPAQFKEAHFATFPPDLIEPCILAGCPQDGIVLDPFSGAGTSGVVAKKHGRGFVGIELNPDYVRIALDRIDKISSNV